MIDAGFFSKPKHPHRFKDSHGANGITVGGVLGGLKTDGHMTLGSKVVDLIRLHLLDDPNQVGAVSEVALVEHEARVVLVRILVEMIDPIGVETA